MIRRLRNVPVPRSHAVALLLGAALHLSAPVRLARGRRVRRAVGWSAMAIGAATAGWAVWAAEHVDLARPTELVTDGPYAVSRNPMYVGWTMLYVGVALVANAAWLLALFPAVAASTHRAVLSEERRLERAFGDEYREYEETVPRYLRRARRGDGGPENRSRSPGRSR